MSQKSTTHSVRGYTIYSIIGTIVELALLLIVALLVLPLFGIYLDPWVTAILVVIQLGFSYFTYYLGRRALQKHLINDLEAIIGMEGKVLESFDCRGYVKVGNELWKANTEVPLKKGDEVVVTSVNGLRIEVAPKSVAGRSRTTGATGK